MTKLEILNKAKYIQFPYKNQTFKDYSKYKINVNRLPLLEFNTLYNLMPTNNHHYTMHYHINYVLPLINKLFDFGYDTNDFELIEYKHKYGDLSYLRPKKDFRFEATCFTDDTKENLSFEDLKPIDKNNVSYRDFYRFPHKCSRIINLDLDNSRKIFISGDSQSIPDIPILACYYKEVWYFDNRTGRSPDWSSIDIKKTKSFNNFYKNIIFNDVLIQLYTNPLWWYTKVNLM